MARNTGSFFREAVRDLLGITRALYRAELAMRRADKARLDKLEEIGKQYKLALELSSKCPPDTMGGRAARNIGRSQPRHRSGTSCGVRIDGTGGRGHARQVEATGLSFRPGLLGVVLALKLDELRVEQLGSFIRTTFRAHQLPANRRS